MAARKAGGPDVKLFYNDYGAEAMGPKADRVLALVKGMQNRGIPIDGVGFQTHVNNAFLSSIPSMRQNLQRFADLGLEIHITELDVRACDASSPCDAPALQKQAAVYSGLLGACLNISACKSFEMWGFTDRHTWITNFNNPTHKNEMPLPYDVDYNAKPAYFSMLQTLQTTTITSRAKKKANKNENAQKKIKQKKLQGTGTAGSQGANAVFRTGWLAPPSDTASLTTS